MEGMKTLDIRSYRETIKAAVAHARRDGGLYCDGVVSKEA